MFKRGIAWLEKQSKESMKEALRTEYEKGRADAIAEKEWSEEDKIRYESCLNRLGTGNPKQPETINTYWFKEHVKPNHWKPSKEQLNALKQCIGGYYSEEADKKLESLYDELKKL